MGKSQPEQQEPRISVKDTVYKLQLALLEGIKTQDHLFLAGSIISGSDYNDVVTERTIANLCGYPLCSNALPFESSRPRKGHYRISLKEHKVYDLHETYMYCSTRCVIESKAFAQSLSEARCDVLDFGKVERILRAFGDVGSDKGEVGFGEIRDLGISKLKIEEKAETDMGDLGISRLMIEEKSETHIGHLGFVGPSNAIEGYIPQKERISRPLGSNKNKEGSKGKDVKMSSGIDIIFNEMDFMSTIIASDEYSVSKIPPSVGEADFETKFEESKGKVGLNKNDSVKKSRQSKGRKNKNVKKDDVCIPEVPSPSDASQTVLNGGTKEKKEEFIVEKAEQSSEAMLRSSLKPSGSKKLNRSVTWADETIDSTGSRSLCEVREMEQIMEYSDAFSSMHEPSVENKVGCSNTWFDEKIDSTKSTNICEVREVKDAHVLGSLDLQENEILESAEACAMALSQAAEAVASGESDVGGAVEDKVRCSNTWFDEKIDSTKSKNIREVREVQDAHVLGSLDLQENEILESAEACAMALSQAAEAVAYGESDVGGAVSGAGIIILPRPAGVDEEEPTEDVDMLEPEQALLWPRKPGIPCSDLFDPEDSWFDAPPVGFSLTLSPFATMWNLLFTCITSSTLAYVYGRDESFHEEFLSVNGREYPPKIVLAGGRSSEIKKTLDESFARALPGVVSELRLPTPISSLEQGMGRMLNTVSFIDAIPAFRMKQWQVIVLLFLEGLSVCRIPALTPHMTNRRILFHKVLENTQISAEQYELMKGLIIPLGRAPQFSAQSGA